MANRRKRNCDVEEQESNRSEKAEQPTDFTKLGKKIRKTREDLGMTQEELALEMGYSSSNSVYRYEVGSNQMGVGVLLLFSKALNKTPNYLLEDILSEMGLQPSGYADLTDDHKRMVDEMIQGLLSLQRGNDSP